MNLVELLDKAVSRYGGKTLMASREQRVSYAEIDEASNKVGNALKKLGVRKGDRVAMLIPNSPKFVAIYFGIIKTGAIAVPMDVRYKVAELASLFGNCQPKVVISESPILDPIVSALPQFKTIERVIELGSTYQGRFLNYAEILAIYSSGSPGVKTAPEDIGTISYTGGPTTHPHGAMLAQGDMVTEAIFSAEGLRQTEEDVSMLFALPLYHQFGMCTALLGSIHSGSTLVCVPGTGISIHTLMAAIEQEKGTILTGVPYIFALMINIAEREGIKSDLRSLRLCISGGAPLSVEVIREFKRHYGFTIMDIYGLTEAMSQVTCPPLDALRIGASGKPLPCWQVKIVDDDGRDLPAGKTGEVIVRGPITKGYYNNPEETAKVIKDGGLYTGDLGKLDSDGYLYITGRKKRMIILKGQNVYPADIEEILLRHPKIAGVRVFGIPDKLRGEVVGAAIVLKEGATLSEQELKHYCGENMADFKLPKQITFTRSLPETTNWARPEESLVI